MEKEAVAELASMVGWSTHLGHLTGGGTLANLEALWIASQLAPGSTILASREAHYTHQRLCAVLGVPFEAVPVDFRGRLDTVALRRRLDRGGVAAVVGTVGTTGLGAVDPLAEILALREQYAFRLHVDAAYGGAFVLCDEGRALLDGIGLADSITFDPHKGLFLPFGTGCLLVRDGRRLRAAHDAHGAYLQDFDRMDRAHEPPSATLHGPELSRSFRGLRLWLPLMVHGARAFREALAEKLVLARSLHAAIEERIARGVPLEIAAPTELSTVTFRPTRNAGESLATWNARNAALLTAINARRRVYLSSTTLPCTGGEVFTLRACILGLRTHASNVAALLEDLDRSLAP
jgi:glutamate/tyrosine decarboxylase-like PLP-dependent enzyme